MRYYLRNPADGAISGPFELDDIEAKLKAGELSADTRATGDIGESLRQVRSTPAEDWMPVQSIPGFGQERPLNVPLRPAPPPEPPPVFRPRVPEAPPKLPPVGLERVNFCPFCGQPVSGAVVPGETRCGQCGKLLYPAIGASQSAAPNRPVSLFTFAGGVIGGLLAELFSYVFILGFFRVTSTKATIAVSCLVFAGWIAIAIPMSRNPANRGFAFGVLLGVGLTALLAASCALK